MASPARKLCPASDRTWWEDEVARLLAAGAELCAGAREAVRDVLLALAQDDASDPETRRDAWSLLAALGHPSGSGGLSVAPDSIAASHLREGADGGAARA